MSFRGFCSFLTRADRIFRLPSNICTFSVILIFEESIASLMERYIKKRDIYKIRDYKKEVI